MAGYHELVDIASSSTPFGSPGSKRIPAIVFHGTRGFPRRSHRRIRPRVLIRSIALSAAQRLLTGRAIGSR